MSDEKTLAAHYAETGVSRFAGNPFIEALPPLEKTRSEFLTNLANYPPIPTATTRRGNEIVRMMELSVLNDVVHPFPEYQKIGLSLATIMRETYVARNPITVVDKQRRHALATRGSKVPVPFPADWRSSAKGHSMITVSGMGKTTFAEAFLLRYPQVIQHTQYHGSPLLHQQVVYVVLRVPHDGTLRSLCLQFFAKIDELLGTNYSREARALRNIAPMVGLMSRVATTVSLGLIVIDEVQNLRSAKGDGAETMLNLFAEIIESLGISLLLLATPAVQSVIDGSVRNIRKLVSTGNSVIKPMGKKDPQWLDFCEVYWDYTFVKRKEKLDDQTRDAWFSASGGNTAFAVLAFMLAQRNGIGGREIVDAAAFERVAATEMAILQPAISALLSGNPAHLRKFDDLIVGQQYSELRALLGVISPEPAQDDEEFEECEATSLPRARATAKRSPRGTSFSGLDLPMEDPLKDTASAL